MAGESYANGMDYEIFIRRAFKCERGKHGAETSLLRFLLEADGGHNNLSGPYSKQFEKVKSYLTKAIEKFISRKPTNEELKGLIQLKEEVLDAPNASALVSLIRYGLDLTHRYRDL